MHNVSTTWFACHEAEAWISIQSQETQFVKEPQFKAHAAKWSEDLDSRRQAGVPPNMPDPDLTPGECAQATRRCRLHYLDLRLLAGVKCGVPIRNLTMLRLNEGTNIRASSFARL